MATNKSLEYFIPVFGMKSFEFFIIPSQGDSVAKHLEVIILFTPKAAVTDPCVILAAALFGEFNRIVTVSLQTLKGHDTAILAHRRTPS